MRFLVLVFPEFPDPASEFDAASEDLFFDRRSVINRDSFFRTGTGDLLHENRFVWKIAGRCFGFLYGYCTQWEADGLSITGIEKFIPGYQIIFCKMDFSRGICFQYPGANRFLTICSGIGSWLLCIEFYCKFGIGERAGSLCRILLCVSIQLLRSSFTGLFWGISFTFTVDVPSAFTVTLWAEGSIANPSGALISLTV